MNVKSQIEVSPNIAVSGWAGVGSTTLTLILSFLLNKKYYPITQIFRTVNKTLGFDNHPILSKEFEEKYQPIIGKTVDSYVDHILTSYENIIVESDIAAFRIGKNPKVYSIFIKADIKSRLQRIAKQHRKDNEAGLDERDKVLKEEYLKLWDIDIFDDQLIERKHHLVLDNTELKLYDEVELVLSHIAGYPLFKDKYDWKKIFKKLQSQKEMIINFDREQLFDKLIKLDLVVPTKTMMEEIVKTFPEEIALFPTDVQKIFIGM